MNKLLARQLEKLGIDPAVVPNQEQWTAILTRMSTAYQEFESQRILQENMIDVSTREMERLYAQLKRESDETIDAQKNQLATVMESVPCWVIWVRYDLVVDGANRRMTDALGVSDLKHLRLTDVAPLKEVTKFMVQFFSSESLEEVTQINISLNNEVRNFKIISRKFSENEKAVIVGFDITEDIQRQIELEAARTTSISSARMAALGEMASGIAHEINNPLAVIYGNTRQVFMRVKSGEFDRDYVLSRLQKIESTIERIKKIIKGLRTFARDGESDPFVPTTIKSIVDDTLELCIQRFQNHNVSLRLDGIPVELSVECRATQLSQVLLNLLGNARDAVDKLGDKWVSLEVKDLGEVVEIAITDSGAGIPDDVAEKIMNPFFTTKEVGVGTGLGLSISKGIVEAHQGRLFLDRASLNTRFVVHIPKVHRHIEAA